MWIEHKFHLKKKDHITGLACYANSINKRADRKDEVKLTRLLLNQKGVDCKTETMELNNEHKVIYKLFFPEAIIKVVEKPQDDNFLVLLEGTDEKFLEGIYNYFIKANMPKETIFTKIDDKLLKIEHDDESEGYVIFESIKKMNGVDFNAYKFLNHKEMQDVLRHADLERCKDYILMRFRYPSRVAGLLL